MRSLSSRAARLLTRVAVTVDSLLRDTLSQPFPAGARQQPYPVDIVRAYRVLQLLATGSSPEEIVQILEEEEQEPN